ncbi:MAG: nitroreductase family protein [Candidatus Brocadiia bacterium]
MELFEAIAARGSKRKYQCEPVPPDVIRKCIEAAGQAPSPHNDQMWKFIVVSNDGLKSKMASEVEAELDRLFAKVDSKSDIVRQVRWYSTFFRDAPVVVACLMKPYISTITPVLQQMEMDPEQVNEKRGRPDYQAMGAAIQNMLLAATALDYGTCWLSGPIVARKGIEAVLGVEPPWKLVALVSLGKPDGDIKQAPKKPLGEIFEIRD